MRISMCHCLDCQKRTGSVFGVQARSPTVLAVSGGMLIVLAVLATLPAAIRAMRVDVRRGISG